jgi:GNAT superfamily N-acetyltransferase
MDAVETRLFSSEDREWLVGQHQTLYARDDGFDDSFGPVVAGIVDSFLAHHDPDCEAGWIVEHADTTQRLGCIFCMKDTKDIARLRMFLLVPEARGRGLGRHLLQTCMEFAQSKGYGQMTLSTHESHTAACALYRAFGWTLEQSSPVRSFGQDLVEQTWSYRF